MCYRRALLIDDRLPEGYDIPLDKFRHVAQEVFPITKILYLSGGGEPLMSRYFPDVLEIVRSYRIPKVEFFTNGMLLDKGNAELIIKAGISTLLISIDGATARSYEAIRVGGKFEKVIGNIRCLNELKNKMGSKTPRIILKMVLMKSNVRELPDFVDLAYKLQALGVEYSHQMVFKGIEDESLVNYPDLSDYYVRSAIERARNLGVGIEGPPLFKPNRTETLAPIISAAAIQNTPCCRRPWEEAVMWLDGTIIPCCVWYGEEPMGNIFKQSFDQIWLGERYNALRQKLQTGKDLPGICRKCPSLVSKKIDGNNFPIIEL